MDVQRFIAEFGHIVNAPGGVARLRELVFSLASDGQLLVDCKDIEPEHLDKVTDFVMGQAPPGNECNTKGDGTVFVKTGEFGELYPIVREWTTRPLKLAKNGDVLICVVGATVGKLNLAIDCAIGRSVAAIRPHTGLDTKYLYFMLMPFTLRLRGGSRGSAQGVIGKAELSAVTLRVPSEAEQSRIVAKVDELMALCDKLEVQQQSRRQLQTALRRATLQAVAATTSPAELHTAWTRLADNFGQLFDAPEDVDELRSLCVELAIRGELVSSDAAPTEDNARSSLADEPFPIPKSWQWIRFDDLLRNSESGWSPKCDAEPRKPGEWGVLKVSAVTWGEFRPQENKRLPPSLEPRPEAEVKPGDFLLSRANTAELVARSVVVPDDVPEKLLMSDKIIRLNFADPERKAWANLVNNSLYARDYYRRNATGTSASMRNVSRQVIHGLPIPLPPKPAQQATLEKLTRLQRWYNLLEQQLRDARKLAERVATAAVSSLTGIAIEQEEAPVKASKTELFAPLHLGKSPNLQAGARDDKPRRGTFVGGALVRVRSQ